MAEEDKNIEIEAETAAAPPEAEGVAEEVPAETATEPAAAAPERPVQAQVAPPEIITPKERRQRSRTARAAKVGTRTARTPEERHQERVAERRGKAQARRVGRERARTKARAASGPAEDIAPREQPPPVQKTRQGVVTSDKADKTITVRVDVARRHRRYQKIVRTSSTLHAHDESNDANTGDTVIIREARPLSRTKRWRLVQVVERAK
jgi:small subunit ribosomal protein S17